MQGSPRRYLLASVVYIGAALLLICLAVFAGSFSMTTGGARISGRFSPLPLFNRSRLEELTLSWNGLDLRFSRASSPGLERFETSDRAADIVLSGDERLRVSSADAAGSALTISQVAEGSLPPGVLTIPFKVSGILQRDATPGTLSWRQGAGVFQLSLPSGSTIDYSSRAISLHVGAAALQPAMRLVSLSPAASPAAPLEASVPAARLPDEKSLPTPDQLAAALARFSDLAYAGWSASRFSPNHATWKMADGKQGFSEEIGVGLLAESLDRGTFADAIQTWSSAFDDQLSQNPALQVTYSACVYSGRLRDFAGRQQAGNAAEVERLKSLAARRDASLANTPGVLLSALDREGPALARTVLSSLRTLDPAGLPTPSLLTVLEALEDYALFVGDDAAVPAAAGDLIEKRLLPSLAAGNDGEVFLRSQTGSVDVKQSVRCGSLLMRAGSLLQSSQLSALGRGLIVSSLSLAEDGGFLPALLSLASGRITPQEGELAPESVYMMLPLGRHIPREIPLYRLMGPGCWAWTAADLTSADVADGQARLVFSFPAGVPQYLVFLGVRPFQQIRLHGIPWHSDPSYAKYSDGWDYDPGSRTLFMKITGKQDREEVDFRF